MNELTSIEERLSNLGDAMANVLDEAIDDEESGTFTVAQQEFFGLVKIELFNLAARLKAFKSANSDILGKEGK